MDKIYTAQDVANVVAKVEELALVNAELDDLLAHGSNDEKLVTRKFELQNAVRKFKSVVSDSEEQVENEEEDLETEKMRAEFGAIMFKYKQRKRELELIIRTYTNGNSD
jgi:hypothetical protein